MLIFTVYVVLKCSNFDPIQSMRRPKLFWVSAAAPLTSVILSTLLVFLLKSKLHGISIVRTTNLAYKFPDVNQQKISENSSFPLLIAYKNWIFWHADWSLTKGSESTFIKYAILPWLLSCSCYQNWHYNWNPISHCKWSKPSILLYQNHHQNGPFSSDFYWIKEIYYPTNLMPGLS